MLGVLRSSFKAMRFTSEVICPFDVQPDYLWNKRLMLAFPFCKACARIAIETKHPARTGFA
jgi:hypothetical protein